MHHGRRTAYPYRYILRVPAIRAPGRINLIGDHTDYNAGFCLPVAIDRACVVNWEPRVDGRVIATSSEFAGTVNIAADGSDDPTTTQPTWGRFVSGAVRELTERGRPATGVGLSIASSVPPGSGLSSSSALSVALTLALASSGNLEFGDRREIAHAALAAEVLATGVPGGLMDQLCSLFGVADHALFIDCRTLDITPIRLPSTLEVVAVHSGIARTLATSEYAARKAACDVAASLLGIPALRDAAFAQVESDPIARHVITENARVLAFVDALQTGDINALGPLMLASHASLRDDYKVSTPELDLLVDLLVEHGAIGARLTGAGFGGCVVALVQRNHADDCLAKTASAYQAQTGVEAVTLVARSADAAGPC